MISSSWGLVTKGVFIGCTSILGVAVIVKMWYIQRAGLVSWQQGEVSVVQNLISFLMSVAAGVAASYISKWLDRSGRDR